MKRITRKMKALGLIGVAIFALSGCAKDAASAAEKKETVSPKYEGIVVVDPAHGGKDTGDNFPNPSITEAEVNQQLAKKLKKELEKENIQVIFTEGILENRVETIEKINPDAVISLHVNSAVEGKEASVYGTETYFKGEENREFAEKLQSQTVKSFGTFDRGIKDGSMFTLLQHKSKAKTAMVEVGFGTNDEDRKKILNQNLQEQFAETIADVLVEEVKK